MSDKNININSYGGITTEDMVKTLYEFGKIIKNTDTFKKEKWNAEKMWRKYSDEYKYLNEIDALTMQSRNITKVLEQIWDCQHFEIQKDEIKYICDFTEVKNKLTELQNILDEL